MTAQRRMSTLIRITLSCLIAFVVAGLVVPARPAAAAADNCQCVGYVVNKLYNGEQKGIPEFGANPYMMSRKADHSLAKTNETSVYWAASPQPIHKPRYNAGWAKAGDVVLFQPATRIYIESGGWKPTSAGSDGHVGIVTHAVYYSSTPSEVWQAVQSDEEDQAYLQNGTRGGWMVWVDHTNWDVTDCKSHLDRFFIPNRTNTSWWREY